MTLAAHQRYVTLQQALVVFTLDVDGCGADGERSVGGVEHGHIARRQQLFGGLPVERGETLHLIDRGHLEALLPPPHHSEGNTDRNGHVLFGTIVTVTGRAQELAHARGRELLKQCHRHILIIGARRKVLKAVLGRQRKARTPKSGGNTVYGDSMRLVIARCSVDYLGRLSAHLPEAVRLIMVKADGCVAIHADGGAYKPLNWMNAPNSLVEAADIWTVTSPKGEQLVIHLAEVLSDTSMALGPDPGLVKDGVETHLQELLAASPEVLGAGLQLVRREYPTDIGPVDLLCRDADGTTVVVEVKRRGEIDGVEQLARYLERLEREVHLRPLRGVFVAQVVKPQARVLAEARGLHWIEVDYDELRGLRPDDLRLF